MSVEEKSKVYLICAGPGNPDLLTKKAERCIK
ncbi:uroporphyrinogen-III C-methyltransferase, partial [Staphylococcus sp. SIMBA_130]